MSSSVADRLIRCPHKSSAAAVDSARLNTAASSISPFQRVAPGPSGGLNPRRQTIGRQRCVEGTDDSLGVDLAIEIEPQQVAVVSHRDVIPGVGCNVVAPATSLLLP